MMNGSRRDRMMAEHEQLKNVFTEDKNAIYSIIVWNMYKKVLPPKTSRSNNALPVILLALLHRSLSDQDNFFIMSLRTLFLIS